MSLGERIKQLRKEKNLSQLELAKKVDSDGRQISLYENGKTVPSPETVVKFSLVFNVTVDYLLKENAPRNFFVIDDDELLGYLEEIQKLDNDDRKCLFHMINSFKTKNKIRAFAHEF